MNLETVLDLAESLCCEISVNPMGKIEIEGDPQNIDKLAPAVRENKTALLCHLTRARHHDLDPGRKWKPGNPFVCQCGFLTGWLRDEKPLCPMCDDKALARMKQVHTSMSFIAISWLAVNRAHLKAAGWTMRELYRRNKSKGIAWAGLWDMPGLTVTIEGSGCISFYFQAATGQKIKQTAWPKKHQRKRSTK
ncbi:MAG: hypothetical protein J0665_07640 [Deltaproteobacteria bacterium]|jgi:hypothetical protein|nr:hypothetical protein [Deltaproteobacteria bacterium]